MKSRSHGADAKRPTGAASDVLRQIVVITALVGMLLGVWLGLGGLNGTPIDQAQGGALAAGASFLTPASTAFSIWSLIYLGLIAYAVWQALPSQRSTPRQRSTGWWIALVVALNGLWLVVVQ